MIKCIAIDDEPLALRQMEKYIGNTPSLEVAATFESAIEAMPYLESEPVDLMFVDINMPDLNGMDFVKSLVRRPLVIFTTAYSEYAVEGFKVDALDYLLKPISYPDFLRAANKAIASFAQQRQTPASSSEIQREFLLVKSEYKTIRIELPSIKYIESMREYVRFHLTDRKPVMSLVSMKKIEDQLPRDQFMRVHRSYIVRLDRIDAIERNRIVFDGSVYIPISKQYSENFQNYLRENYL